MNPLNLMKPHWTFTVLLILTINSLTMTAQSIPLGEMIQICTSPLKEDTNIDDYVSFMENQLLPGWNKNNTAGASMYLLKADRGDRNGEYLTVSIISKTEDRKKLPKGSLFTDKAIGKVVKGLTGALSDYLSKPDNYTEYQLIGGADQFQSLPTIDLLGIHFIQVKPDRTREFEQLVVNKLHPAVGHLVHDMNLIYYKAVAGDNKGSYITIFAIESVEARERFWPTGGTEQEIVKQLFGPHKELARELGSYLVEDSYLGPESGGAGAYFESMEWTDFVILN